MRLFLLSLLLPLAAAQLPFDIFNTFGVPSSVTDVFKSAFKTYFEVTKMETDCFRDITRAYSDMLQAGLTAMHCRSLDCFRDEKITNATYAMKMLASIGRPHSLAMDELALTYAGDPRLCRTVEGPFPTKYCFAHVSVDYKNIDIASYGFDLSYLPGGKIPDIVDHTTNGIEGCTKLGTSNVHVAFCMPASCQHDKNVGRILHEVTYGKATLCDIACEGPVKEKSAFFYFFNTIIISLLSIAFVASLLDYWATSEGKEAELKGRTAWRLLMSFSVPRNTISIFSIRQDPSALQCLDAIRWISFTWVASLHCNMYTADGDNMLQYIRESDYFFSDIFLNSYTSVDTFFLISGLLVSFSFFKRMHKNPEEAFVRSKWIKHYVHRWLRLTPAYILFIGFYIVWTPRMHGVWAIGNVQNSTSFVENCESTWWMNALYINNINGAVDMCYGVSWFLAVDMQLYWIAPIFLLAIFYSWRTGLLSILVGIFLSMAAIVFLTAYFDLPVLPVTAKDPGNFEYVNLIYMKPWTRCIPYLAGILCGYLIVQVREKTIVLRKPQTWMILLAWIVAATLALTVVFVVYDYVRGASDWSIATRALYGCFARIGWSIAVGWVILACTFGWAGPISTILSHPLWYPLGRLSYCAFLTHWFLIHLLLDGDDRPAHFVSLWHTYLTLTVPVVFLSFIGAYCWSCLVEIPFGKIEGIVTDLISRPKIQDKSAEPRIATAAWRDTNGDQNKLNGKSIATSIEVNSHRVN